MKIRPAHYVIKMFGGVRATARALDRDPSNVAKWRKTKARGGTGGQIPQSVHSAILAIASKRNLDITPLDIIEGREL